MTGASTEEEPAPRFSARISRHQAFGEDTFPGTFLKTIAGTGEPRGNAKLRVMRWTVEVMCHDAPGPLVSVMALSACGALSPDLHAIVPGDVLLVNFASVTAQDSPISLLVASYMASDPATVWHCEIPLEA